MIEQITQLAPLLARANSLGADWLPLLRKQQQPPPSGASSPVGANSNSNGNGNQGRGQAPSHS